MYDLMGVLVVLLYFMFVLKFKILFVMLVFSLILV